MKNIDLVFITDEGFALLTGVAIYSLKKNSNKNFNYNINIICSNVTEESLENFKKLSSKNFNIKIIDVDGSKYEDLKKSNLHVSTTALFKFDIPNIFPDLNKILYIDGDVLIQSDLVNLFETDIDKKYAGVVVDYGGLTYPSDFKKRLKTKHKYYFNSGMMLLNLKKLREDNISDKLITYRKNGNNYYMDQDAFNIVFKENVKYLSLNYNFVITGWRDFEECVLTDFFGLQKQISRIDYLKKADIIHFASGDKPSKYEDVPLANLWYSYFSKSTFLNYPLNRTYLKKQKPNHVYFTNPELVCDETNKTDTPSISVVIPIYNALRYIIPTLKTVTSQNLRNIEIICVDDGSTDGTYERLKEFQKEDSRVKLFKQKNQFAGVARNNGIKYAKGDYIVFLDADDKLENGALMKMYQKAILTNSDVVLTGAFFLDDVTKKVTTADFCLRVDYLPNKEVFCAEDIPNYIFNITGGNPWAKCYKRDFLLKNPQIKFLPIKRSEDFYFVCLSLIYAKRISALTDRLFFYRINNSTSLESTKDDTPLLFWDANIVLMEYLKKNKLYKKFEKSFLNDVLNRMVYNLRQVKTVNSLEQIFLLLKSTVAPLLNIESRDDKYWYFKNNLEYIKYFLNIKDLMQYFNDLLLENKRLKLQLSRIKDRQIKEKFQTEKKPENKFLKKLKLAKKRGLRYCFIRLFRGRQAGDRYLTDKGLW